jgi:putative endonuclease
MEPFHVYILYSATLNKYYIGHTRQLDDRLFRHTNSGSKSTKAANDWQLLYSETYPTRSDAMKRESYIKKQKSRQFIESLLKSKTN